MGEVATSKIRMTNKKCCVIIPTYNNATTLAKVIESVMIYANDIFVVNDGSTDNTLEIIQKYPNVNLVSYPKNQGKGYALRTGFKAAVDKGFEYAITIDSDGQHFAEDIPVFLDKLDECPDAVIVGARNMQQASVPGKSSFGHKFSNFWFRFETGVKLPDTQSGYRLYPIKLISKKKYFTRKYEFEIEIIVRAAWSGLHVTSVPVKVYYAPISERVSHFRPFRDFSRVSLINAALVTWMFLWILPFKFFRKLNRRNVVEFLNRNFLNSPDSNLKISAEVAFGIFMGIVPLWGFQMLTALLISHLLKLNKVLVIVAANISIPPVVPFILFFSYQSGGLFLGHKLKEIPFNEVNIDALKNNLEQFIQYILGSFVFATALAILIGTLTFLLLLIFRKKKLIH